jgi:hypothetical protein
MLPELQEGRSIAQDVRRLPTGTSTRLGKTVVLTGGGSAVA